MSPKITAVIAVTVTAIAVMLFAGIVTTPEVITQILMGGAAFFVTGLTVLILLWLPWMRALPERRQTLVIWIVAAVSGTAVYCLPLLLLLFRR